MKKLEDIGDSVRLKNEFESQGGSSLYKIVVRPAMMYGAETWAVKKAQEKKLDVAEMRMLRWMSGVTKLDRIRNERIRGTTKVEEISKKVQDRRLKWYGHVWRREDEYVGKRVMGVEVPGERRRGRPKRRWLNSRNDFSERDLSGEDTQDRPRWRRLTIKTHRPHIKVGKDEEEERPRGRPKTKWADHIKHNLHVRLTSSRQHHQCFPLQVVLVLPTLHPEQTSEAAGARPFLGAVSHTEMTTTMQPPPRQMMTFLYLLLAASALIVCQN